MPCMTRSIQRIIGLACRWIGAAILLGSTAPTRASDTELFEAMRHADVALATIGFKLSKAAAPLCDRLEPGLGFQLHFLTQYGAASRERVRTHFRFSGPVATEGVVAGSPAALAGLQPDDGIFSIDGVTIPDSPSAEPTTAPLQALYRQLAARPPNAPVDLVAQRGDRRFHIELKPVPACRTRYELRIADSFDARANGELVQISSKYFEVIDPDLLPAVIAHELSHNILRHRDRLKAVGADFGLASGFGRNVGFFRQTEIEADILSVHLLARAGYPPMLAARFWGKTGEKVMAGMIRSRSHPSIKDRIAALEAEAARVATPGEASLPAFYATRDKPLDGNWRALLQRP